MKKVKYLFLFFTLFFLSLPLNLCHAWANGSYGYDNVQYDYASDYSSHDWVADGALQALLAYDASNWGWLDDVNRKKIFLIGTEAPDNSGVAMTLDGESITGFGDTPNHHVYFGAIKSNVTEDDAAVRARDCGDTAAASINSNKLDKAAFYLGAMAHYIGDLAMYAHVVKDDIWPDYRDFDDDHSTVESRVKTRTNDYENKEEFFKFSSISIVSKKPYDAAIDLNWETYKDPTPSDTPTRDAVWLDQNFIGTWASNYAARLGESATNQKYYNRIEECLNNAIEAVASAMNYVGGVKSTIPSYPLPLVTLLIGCSVLGLIFLEMKRKRK
jgi:hypothetical protein